MGGVYTRQEFGLIYCSVFDYGVRYLMVRIVLQFVPLATDYPARVCAGGVKRLLLSIRLTVRDKTAL